jgi:hypothetical protein
VSACRSEVCLERSQRRGCCECVLNSLSVIDNLGRDPDTRGGYDQRRRHIVCNCVHICHRLEIRDRRSDRSGDGHGLHMLSLDSLFSL